MLLLSTASGLIIVNVLFVAIVLLVVFELSRESSHSIIQRENGHCMKEEVKF